MNIMNRIIENKLVVINGEKVGNRERQDRSRGLRGTNYYV